MLSLWRADCVCNDYNHILHYESKHTPTYKLLTDAECGQTSEPLLAKLQKQQGLFTKLYTSRDGTFKTSFVISHKIASLSKNVWWCLTLKKKADSLVCFLLGSRWELWCSPHTSVTHLCTCGNERVWDYRGTGSNALSETDSDSKWIVHGGWKWTNWYCSQSLSKSDREKFQTFEVDAR